MAHKFLTFATEMRVSVNARRQELVDVRGFRSPLCVDFPYSVRVTIDLEGCSMGCGLSWTKLSVW